MASVRRWRARGGSFARAALAVLAAAGAPACEEIPAQVVVFVDTDMTVPDEMDGFRVRVGEDGEALDRWFPVAGQPEVVALPASFGVAPKNGDAGHRVRIGVEATRSDPATADAAVLFETTAVTSFIDGARLRLDMFLARRCKDLVCDPGLTCRPEGCVSPELRPGELPVVGQGSPPPLGCEPAGLLGSVAVYRGVGAIAVQGDLLAVADVLLDLVDVSDPRAPTAARVPVVFANAFDVEIWGDAVLVVDVGGLFALDGLGTGNLTRRGTLGPTATGLAALDPPLFLVDTSDDLLVVDASDVDALREVGRVSVGGNGWDVDADGPRAYLARYYDLRIYDLSEPSAPAYLGAIDLPDGCDEVTAIGNFALVSCAGHLHVVDATNPRAAVEVPIPDWPSRSVTLRGSYALVAGLDEGLLVLDVRDPASPAFVASFPTASGLYALSVAVSGELAFVGTAEETPGLGPGYVDVFDVSCFGP